MNKLLIFLFLFSSLVIAQDNIDDGQIEDLASELLSDDLMTEEIDDTSDFTLETEAAPVIGSDSEVIDEIDILADEPKVVDEIDILADELLPDDMLDTPDTKSDELALETDELLPTSEVDEMTELGLDEEGVEAPVLTTEIIVDPEPHEKYRLVPQGSVIYEIESKKALRINNDLMVEIKDYEEDSEFILIETKKEKKKYLVHFKSLENLNEVLKLKRPPKYYQELPMKKSRKQVIADYSIDQNLNIMMGAGIVSFLPQRSSELANSNNLFYRAYFNTKKRWQIGMSINWENTESVGQQNNYSYNAFLLGPTFKYTGIFGNLDFSLGLTQSFSSALKIEQAQRIRFNQTTLLTSLEKKTDYPLGTFILGVNFNVSRLKIKDSNAGAFSNGRLDTHYTVGFMVGHGFY